MVYTAGLRVYSRVEIGTVNPFLFGHFLEHFPGQIYGGVFDPASPHADRDGFRQDVISALRSIGVPIIRWPGGCYASAYHWRWGAGPQSERQARPSTVWRFTDSHQFGTTEFAELCRQTGAEPLICVGIGRGKQHPTPDEAAGWVRYCNAVEGPEAELRKRAGYTEPLNVTLWGLGNEVFAGIYDDPNHYAQDLLSFATAMREADPRLRFVIVGAEREWLWDWNEALLANDDVVRAAEWISWHDYLHTGMCESRSDGSGRRQTYQQVIESLQEVERTIEKHRRINRGMKLAVDEWNELGWELFDKVSENDLPETYTLANAIYTAGFLNVLVRHADMVTMANYSPTVNTRGLLFAGPHGILLRPTYHVYQLYQQVAGATAVKVELDSERLNDSSAPAIDAAATLGPAPPAQGTSGSQLTLLAINRHATTDARCEITLDTEVAGAVCADLLTGDSLNSFNSFAEPETVHPVKTTIQASGEHFSLEIPARSVLVVTIPVVSM